MNASLQKRLQITELKCMSPWQPAPNPGTTFPPELACSVGLIDHGLNDPAPGVDEPEETETGGQ